MRLYHVTTCDAAKAILRDGFRDTVGTYGTDWSGVWLVDRPLYCDDTDNVSVDTILAVSLDCGPRSVRLRMGAGRTVPPAVVDPSRLCEQTYAGHCATRPES